MKILLMPNQHDALFRPIIDALRAKFGQIRTKEQKEENEEFELIIVFIHFWRENDPGLNFIKEINPSKTPTLLVDTEIRKRQKSEFKKQGFITFNPCFEDLDERIEELAEAYYKVKGKRPCPYYGKAYKDVPGYVTGFGCPVCKSLGPSHIDVSYPS